MRKHLSVKFFQVWHFFLLKVSKMQLFFFFWKYVAKYATCMCNLKVRYLHEISFVGYIRTYPDKLRFEASLYSKPSDYIAKSEIYFMILNIYLNTQLHIYRNISFLFNLHQVKIIRIRKIFKISEHTMV